MVENKLNQKMLWRNKNLKIKNVKETRKRKQVVQTEMLMSVRYQVFQALSMYFKDLQVTDQKFVKAESVGHSTCCRETLDNRIFLCSIRLNLLLGELNTENSGIEKKIKQTWGMKLMIILKIANIL